ncbi:D-beta-hydroxybutyrate dehydrogenase, mitochondrial-like isoform X1 [Ruditapes philippinarum]|uniref:D-beta-hydroxybutyrate dehydrogenase, mitochondrial-like isoform X1 n=1 Tax=Ruditapes philippinarum TaxID=129788 RepID=UPI00295B4637|nr:D-beta-hydroxybutyrate dehydrogenase, mitochondrial-like isoform X1 [Ruditapes philippinarum]
MMYETYRTLFAVSLLFLPYLFFRYFLLCLFAYVIYKIVRYIYIRNYERRVSPKGRGVFITGCDSGLGFLFAKHFDELGFTVFAGCLHKQGEGADALSKQSSGKIHVVQIDVTDDQSIEDAFQYVSKHVPSNGLFGVINNAGMNMYGEVELTPLSIYEKGFNVNLYGGIRVLKKFLPQIRQSKGRIINVTSVHGLLSRPCQSNYETAKHDFETLSDSLRLEMKKFGVKVIVIEPGMYGTCTSVQSKAMTQRNINEIDEMWNDTPEHVKKDYTKEYMLSWLPKPMAEWPPPKHLATPVVMVAEHALCSEFPETRYLVDGYGNRLSFIDEFAVQARLFNKVPTWVADLWMIHDHMKN